jgi:hypothetical protein
MNTAKLSVILFIAACAFMASAYDMEDSSFEDEFVQSNVASLPAANHKKAIKEATQAHHKEVKKTHKLHRALSKKIHTPMKKGIRKATKKHAKLAKKAAKHANLVKHFTKLAKTQAKKNKHLRKRQRQARNSAIRTNARNHFKMVKDQAKLLKTLSHVAASQKRMLAGKAKLAKFYNAQIVKVAAESKAAKKATKVYMRKYRAKMQHMKNKIKFNKKLFKDIQKKWNGIKAKSEKKSKAIKATFARRTKKLAKQNAANLKKFNADVAKGQAKFAAMAKNNKMKAALAKARIKLQAKLNKIAEKHTKLRAAKLNARESSLKAAAKRKETGAKKAANKKLAESRQKEKIQKLKISNEADTKYARKKAHAAIMTKKANKAKAIAAAAVRASEKSTKAQKLADAKQAKVDKNIKECGADECLKGAKCIKTGKKTGFYLDQVGFVKCTKKKPKNMIGDWAGSPFKESDFPEAHYVEPKFEMPKMPGFTFKK